MGDVVFYVELFFDDFTDAFKGSELGVVAIGECAVFEYAFEGCVLNSSVL